MHPKIKSRPIGKKAAVSAVKPLLLHDVTQQTASANAASRRRATATQPASGTANHARHHVSRHTQA
jgi:hypothetical protein